MLNIYKASAGSGKTYRLALEYIKTLLGVKGPDGRLRLNPHLSTTEHRRIVAMTFTNKATEEMKRRILHELARLGECEPGWSEPSSYEKELVEAFGCSKEQLVRASQRALAALVLDYNFFNVSTIDSFFQQVLRAFAREAQLTGDYNLSLDDTGILELGVRRMLSELNHADPADPVNARTQLWLYEFMHNRMLEGKAYAVFNAVSQVRKDLITCFNDVSDEKFQIRRDRMYAYLTDPAQPLLKFMSALGPWVEDARKRISALGMEMQREVERAGKDGGLPKGHLTFISNLAEGTWKEGMVTQKTMQKFLDGDEDLFKKNCYNPALGAILSRLTHKVLECIMQIFLGKAAKKDLHILGLLARVRECADQELNNDNAIRLSDTNALLSSIIGNDTAPFIYEKLGVQIGHYLIDEFQDTSMLQWHNLRPLVAESHAYDHDNLIIGDEKQCIYRFRNSDPSLLKEQVQRQFDRVALSGNTVEQNTNWRSSSTVVRFNNTLYESAALEAAHREIYANVVQKVSGAHAKHTGYVSVRLYDEAADEYRHEALQRMIGEIDRQLQAGYLPSDIAVLCRKNKEAQDVIGALLTHARTPEAPSRFGVISDDALQVGSAPVVRNIITRLRFLGAPDIASRPRAMTPRRFAALFNSYEQRLSDRSSLLAERLKAEGVTMADDRGRQIYDELASQALADTVATLAESAGEEEEPEDNTMATFGADTVLASDLGVIVERILALIPRQMREEQAMYVTAFMDLVYEYVDTGINDVNSFLKWWDTTGHTYNISSPPSADAIRVMTVHKSKGLEFKCVHIPFAAWDMNKVKGAVWFEPVGFDGIDPAIVPPMIPLTVSANLNYTSLEPQIVAKKSETRLDELNALYVATTRAVDELVMSVNLSKADDTTGGLLAGALQKMTVAADDDLHLPVSYDDESRTYSCGVAADREENPVTQQQKSDPPKALEPTAAAEMPPYYVLDRSDLWRNTSVELPGTLDDDNAGTLYARTRGRLLHAVLEHVRTPADIDRAIARTVQSGLLLNGEVPQVAAMLHRELERPEVKPWFDGYTRLLTEQPIFTGVGHDGAYETRRPDRIVFTRQGTVDIIDYKTGTLPTDPKELREVTAAYNRQVSHYIRLLTSALPDLPGPVRGFVWHLDSGTLWQVP